MAAPTQLCGDGTGIAPNGPVYIPYNVELYVSTFDGHVIRFVPYQAGTSVYGDAPAYIPDWSSEAYWLRGPLAPPNRRDHKLEFRYANGAPQNVSLNVGSYYKTITVWAYRDDQPIASATVQKNNWESIEFSSKEGIEYVIIEGGDGEVWVDDACMWMNP